MTGALYRHAALQLLAMLGLSLAATWGALCRAQTESQDAEYRVKAAFLYKFASYVEWPSGTFERADSPLVIGIAGADVLADKLGAAVSGRSIGDRPVIVRRFLPGDPVKGLHVLFIGRSERVRATDVLASAKGRAVLTVTESDEQFALGGVINFVILDNKVRFDVALRHAELGNLKISTRLLSVARKVISGPS